VGSATILRLLLRLDLPEFSEESEQVQATGGLGRLEGVGGW